jgi:cobalt/nickel transport system permease protein
MRDRFLVLLYAAAVVVATTFHELWLIAGLLAATSLLAGRRFWPIARRALVAVALFTSAVMATYAVATLVQGTFSAPAVALIILRVLTLTFMTMLLADRINLLGVFAFSRTLVYLVTLTTSQALTLRRIGEDFRLSLRSRTLARPSARALTRHGAATAAFFIDKSMSDAAEVTQAMKSRGFFDDQG